MSGKPILALGSSKSALCSLFPTCPCYMRPYVHLNAAIQEEALWFLRWGGTLVYVA